uniref:RING-type domain-containing protein n=1 Tax=Anopheles coluzzii TaxID=1518534 RepID=A0A8W7PYN5_ANOCL
MTQSSDIICDACQKPEDYNTSIVYHCGHFIHYKCLVMDKRCPFCLDEIFLSSATYEDASAYAVWDAECPGAQLSLVRKEMRALKLYEMKLIGIMGTLIENLDFLLAVAAAKELAATDELYKKYKLLEAELMAAAPEPEPVALFL